MTLVLNIYTKSIKAIGSNVKLLINSMDTDSKFIRILKDFLTGKASTQEIHFLLPHLDDLLQWENWTKEKWENAEDDINCKIERKMLSEIRKSIHQKQMVNFRNYWAVAASVLVLILSATSLFLWMENNKNSKFKRDVVVTVERGQKASVLLSDNTMVWINSGSELRYGADFNAHERKVELIGEAYFNVAHHSDSPFIVKSGDLSVTALGTSFNVEVYPEDPSISVRENKIVIENQSLLDITNTLSRQYNVDFEFKDESLKNYSYSGTIENTSLQSILEMISLTSPVNYQVRENEIVLSENLLKYYHK